MAKYGFDGNTERPSVTELVARQREINAELDAIAVELETNQNLVILEPITEPDDFGRQQFTAHWWGYRIDLGAHGPRAQVFHAEMAAHAEHWRSQGKEIKINSPEE